MAAFENNEQQQLSEGFANSCYKIVSPILLQELINDSVVCKHCGRTFLLSENVTLSVYKTQVSRLSEDVLGVFRMSYTRSIYLLWPEGSFYM